MAQLTTNITDTRPGLFERFMDFMVSIAESNSRMRRVEFLNSLSNDELKARGLRREDIVRHVFADAMAI
ncbi:DUF1127 domain-containing protein [Marinovum sp.]|uniref:DUF1127 domain-containing protein n=1 Tax=Marinovum sp. TaxID=2024839 RepID=UPI002B2677D2|nr:DUF1127 domain-containing protein [Marinovum sp.]